MMDKKNFKVLLVYPNLSMMLTPSCAVGIFTRILKKSGYSVSLFDCTPYNSNLECLGEPMPVSRAKILLNSRSFNSNALFGAPKTDLKADFAKHIEDFKPHVVIFSTLVEDTWPQLEELLQVIKLYPEVSHIAGGVYAIMAPQLVIDHPNIQCIGTGEGEEVIQDFCEAVRLGVDRPTDIGGTWAKTKDGQIIKNKVRPLVNINSYPPDYSLFDERRFLRPLGEKVWKVIPIETYRGCPYTCTFCNSPMQNVIAKESGQGNYLRRKSVETLRDEISTVVNDYSCEFIYILDDAFMARPRKELFAVAKMLKEFSLPFWFQTRFEDITKPTLEALKEAGCYRISFGLEHGNEKFRQEKLARSISNEEIIKKSKIVHEVGIPYTINIIIGMPYETRELTFETIDLLRTINHWDSLSVGSFVPYHGTVLREKAIQEGWLDPNLPTNSYISGTIVDMPSPPYLDSSEVLGLLKTIPLYSRFPKSRYNDIHHAELEKDPDGPIIKLLREEWYKLTYGMDEKDRNLTYQG
jgi:anaerobic magnesium-protoporphyrin IX monomethyl ester cyclase